MSVLKRILEKGFFFFVTLRIILKHAITGRGGMNLLLHFMIVCTFFSFSCVAFMEPEKGLKAPGEIMQEIERFLQKKEGDSEYIKGLLVDALYVSHVCQVSLDSDAALLAWFDKGSGQLPDEVNDLAVFIRQCQDNSRDDEAYLGLLHEDFKIITADCSCNCSEYKQLIKTQIPLLHELYKEKRAMAKR